MVRVVGLRVIVRSRQLYSLTNAVVFQRAPSFHGTTVPVGVAVSPVTHGFARWGASRLVKGRVYQIRFYKELGHVLDTLLRECKSDAGWRPLHGLPANHLEEIVPEQTFLCRVEKVALGTKTTVDGDMTDIISAFLIQP